MLKVAVTGNFGFLGQRIVRFLRFRNTKVDISNRALVSLPSRRVDLTDSRSFDKWINTKNIDYVIHCAGLSGGLEYNKKNPASIFADNTAMAINVIKTAYKRNVKRVIFILSSCSYPDNVVLTPSNYLAGLPHESVAAQAYAKRNTYLLSKYYREQFGFDSVCVCPAGLYGPKGTFQLDKAKVLHCLIHRIVVAHKQNLPSVQLLGNGQTKRQFIYVDDAAQLIVKTMLELRPEDSHNIIHLSWDTEYTIEYFARKIAELVGYQGTIEFTSNTDEGQTSKELVTNMHDYLSLYNFRPVPLDVGLTRCINLFKQGFHKHNAKL